MKETELKNQTIDLIWNGYTKTPERAKKVGFSAPYLVNHQVLVTKANQNITSAAKMRGKTLGVQTGSSGASDLDGSPQLLKRYIKNQSPVLYDTFNNGLIDLNAGRIQGLLMDEIYARYYIAHEPNPESYRVVSVNFPSEHFAVGMRKSDKVLKSKSMPHLRHWRRTAPWPSSRKNGLVTRCRSNNVELKAKGIG